MQKSVKRTPSPFEKPYELAELKGSSKNYYIEFYQTDPETGKKERFRQTHNLNRIKDHPSLQRKAREIIKEINGLLPQGWPYVTEAPKAIIKEVSVEPKKVTHTFRDALEFAVSIKKAALKNPKSFLTYPLQQGYLMEYADLNGISDLEANSFTKKDAYRFMDMVRSKPNLKTGKELSTVTLNNYIIILKSLFYVLEERGIIDKNPFAKFPKYRAEKKHKREFNDYERRVVSTYIMEKDPLLFLGILLVFYCFLRPKDIRNIRFGQIDIKKQLITTMSDTSKNGKTQHVTIPDILKTFLLDMPEFERFPMHYYVFGAEGLPGTVKAGEHLLANRHQKILKKMQAEGYLTDITGLSFYSWKYSGNQALFDMNINLMDIKNQNRHHSITVTQIYAERFNPGSPAIKKLNHDIRK